MPEITIRYTHPMTSHVAKLLATQLRRIVSEALSDIEDKGEDVRQEDIVVRFAKHHEFDLGTSDLEVNILTGDILGLTENIDDCTDYVARETKTLLGKIGDENLISGTHCVWLVSGSSGFAEF